MGIATGLLANDIVGFQTERYAHNFLRMVESFVPDAKVDYSERTVRRRRRTTHVRHYPISIDVDTTRLISGSRPARRRADQLLGAAGERVIVRVDRLEPSKNIVRGFLAYEALLQRHPRLRGRISFLAFLVPSRTGLREYGDYGRSVQNAVDRINARFGRAGWRPVQIFYENDYAQALAGLSIADVVLVNPLVDGMNLVAKEAVVVSQRDAVLILSETAGAFDQMADGALAVAPADVIGTADALATALAMPLAGAPAPPRPAPPRRRARGHQLVAAHPVRGSRRAHPLSAASSAAASAGSARTTSQASISAGSTSAAAPPTPMMAARRRPAPRSSSMARNMSRSVTSSPITTTPAQAEALDDRACRAALVAEADRPQLDDHPPVADLQPSILDVAEGADDGRPRRLRIRLPCGSGPTRRSPLCSGTHPGQLREPPENLVQVVGDGGCAGSGRRLGSPGLQPLHAVVAGDQDPGHAGQLPRVQRRTAGDDRDDVEPLREGGKCAVGARRPGEPATDR